MRKPLVLFVDDEEQIEHPYEFYLTRAIPCKVVRAFSGEEALGVARQIRPDIILLDLKMPGLDGFETCKQLREEVTLEATPIIILTKKLSGGPDERRAFSLGANKYLHKPIAQEDLCCEVRSALEVLGFRTETDAT